MAPRALVPTLLVRTEFPPPSISMVNSITPSPLAVTVTKVTPGGTMILPAQTPLAVAVTKVEPFVPPGVNPLAVAVTKPTAYLGGEYFVQVFTSASLVGYWRLNETSGTVAADLKNGNNGTYTSSPTLNQAGPLTKLSDSLGVKFVSSGYVVIPDSTALDVGDTFTVECIVKRSSTGVTHSLVSKSSDAFAIRLASDDSVGLVKPGVATLFNSPASSFTDTTKWHHIVVTKTGATVAIYIDGVSQSLSGSDVTIVSNVLPLTIGQDDSGGTYHATDDYISEVAIYNTALSGATVTNHYNAAVNDGLL